jgi:hypothetical protein
MNALKMAVGWLFVVMIVVLVAAVVMTINSDITLIRTPFQHFSLCILIFYSSPYPFV